MKALYTVLPLGLILICRGRETFENVVFIKMRHFSDFETYSHILQVQFFPSKIQF
jgi:hypothetical protein